MSIEPQVSENNRCWDINKSLTIWFFIVVFWCFNISSSEFNFLAATLYSSILVRLSACDGVSPVPSRHGILQGSHLELVGLSVLMSLQITESGDELDHFLPLKRRMVVPLQVVLCSNRTDESFAFFDPTRLCLCVTSSVRSGERR